MHKLVWVALLIAGCCSCVQHQTNFSRRKAALAQSRTPKAEGRVIGNATDAGSGDLELLRLRRRMEAEPENLPARLELAAHYSQAGFPEIAIEHYRLAAQRFPGSEEVRILLAKGLRAEGLTALAVEGLELFAKGHPASTSRVESWIGILRDELGHFELAEKAHREALRKAPRQDLLHNNLGYNLLLQGKKDAAAAEFRQALALNRHSQVAANNLATALAATSGEPEAAKRLESTLDRATAHNNLAAILLEQGRYPEARQELARALKHNRNHTAALRNLALLAELDGKPAALPARHGRGPQASKTDLSIAATPASRERQERP
ncbi:MAG: tetratricopeptide repeat protein [Acidobacteria bacterium]|nr:tetratricopeptide repeat protein [Acidobacteriota bacterium]